MPLKVRSLALAVLTTAVCAGGCKKTEPGNSNVKFITISQQFNANVAMIGMLAKVKNPTIKICNNNFAPTDQYGTLVSSIVMRWVAAIQSYAVDNLASKVEFVNSGCDGTVTYDPAKPDGSGTTRAYCDISTIEVGPKIMIGDNQAAFPLEGTLAHEFGHAFGLGDTYENGTSGDCQPGQMDSLMCDTKFTAPAEDDINGLVSMYVEQYGASSVRKTPQTPSATNGGTANPTPNGAGSTGNAASSASGSAASTAAATATGPIACFCAAGSDTKGRTVCGVQDANKAWVTPSYYYANGQACDANFCTNNFPNTTANICGGNMAVDDSTYGLTTSQTQASETPANRNPVWFSNLADACRCGFDTTKLECGIFGQADTVETADTALAVLTKAFLGSSTGKAVAPPLCNFRFCSAQVAQDASIKTKINGRCNLDHLYAGPPGGAPL